MDSRRDFIKKMALLSAATGISSTVPASIKKALAINPQSGTTYLDAEHVVILMQENRSFDHTFGTLRGVRGYNDPRAIRLPNKNLVWFQSEKKGDTCGPFRYNIKDTKITWMGSIPHSRSSQVDADNNGRYDNWLEAKRSGNKKYGEMPLTMGHYTREDLPFNYALADAFTICDQHFCSAMTSTWPNRLYMWTGTIRDRKSGYAKAYVRNNIPWGEANWKTFPERLQDNHISWKVYQNDITTGGGFQGDERAWLSNFGCNALEFLSQYNTRFAPRYIQSLKDRLKDLPEEIGVLTSKMKGLNPGDDAYENFRKQIDKKNEVLQEAKEELEKWSPENFENLSQYQKELYQRAFTINDRDPDYHTLEILKYDDNGQQRELNVPKGDVLYQFRKDVETGQLPTVSWLVPSQNLSDHPSAPWYGSWFTSEILDILTQNPEVWKKTIFILTFDENDGYFDHQPPFVAPDPEEPLTGKCSPGINVTGGEFIRREDELRQGISKKEARSGPIGLGFRVPMIIASPWSRGGKVCSQVFDHTSTIQFLEDFLNKKYGKSIREENITDWRRAICGDLTSAFTPFDGNEKEKMSFFLSRDPHVEEIYNAKFKEEPNNFKNLSKEELASLNREGSLAMGLQEKGTKTSRPLPYELYVDGHLSADRKSFEVHMQSGNKAFKDKSSGSPFIIYAPDEYITLESEKQGKKVFQTLRVWHYAVKAGDELADSWSLESFKNGLYHLCIYGPNGFFREFSGNSHDPLVETALEYKKSRLTKNQNTGNLILNISNKSQKQLEVLITDNAYKNPSIGRKLQASGNEAFELDLNKSHGWYDFTLTIPGNSSFLKRYAGRTETGKESTTDPYMGGIIA